MWVDQVYGVYCLLMTIDTGVDQKALVDKASPRLELGSLDSKSRVLTATPRGHDSANPIHTTPSLSLSPCKPHYFAAHTHTHIIIIIIIITITIVNTLLPTTTPLPHPPQHHTTLHCTTQHNTTRHKTTRHNTIHRNTQQTHRDPLTSHYVNRYQTILHAAI